MDEDYGKREDVVLLRLFSMILALLLEHTDQENERERERGRALQRPSVSLWNT